MTFVEAVRSGQVKGPQQRGYQEADWQAVYQAEADGGEADQLLFTSGVWFGSRFASARVAWEALARLPYSTSRLARLFIGVTNYQIAHASPEIPHFASEESVNVDAYSTYMRKLTETSEKVQHAIESLRIPLSNALAGREPNGREEHADPRSALFNGLLRRTVLGQHYKGLEDLWAQCVWSGWYVAEYGDTDLIRPSDEQHEIWRAASRFRRESIRIEMSLHAQRVWKNSNIALRREWANAPVVTRIERHAKRLKLVLGMLDTALEHPPFAWIARVLAVEQYLEGVLDEALPKLQGVTIRELLDTYWLFAPLAQILAEDAIDLEALESLGDIELCAPRLHQDDCARALVRGLGVAQTKAESIIRILTFEGSPRDDLWLKPFVLLDDSWITVLFEPLRTPNMLWLIDSWLRLGGFEMQTRGPAFEHEVRHELADANKLSTATVVPGATKVRAAGVEEEIDVLLRVGHTLLIGEAKCSIFPAEPYELATYEDVLKRGASQAKRKANFTRAHLHELTKQLGWVDFDVKAATVLPVVVTNLPLGAALPGADASVTDLFILRRYLSEGKLEKFVAIGTDGHQSATEERFYATPEDAERNIGNYLLQPPQLTELLKTAKSTVRTLIYFHGERPANYVVIHCDPYDVLRSHLQ